jgi:hypothetical protein
VSRDYEYELAQMKQRGASLRRFLAGGNAISGLMLIALAAVAPSFTLQNRLVFGFLGLCCLLIMLFALRVKS